MSRATKNRSTIITFRFKKAAGFRIGNSDGSGRTWGNFYPTYKQVAKNLPQVAGNTWVEEVDLDKHHEVELDFEDIRPLPPHILQHQDEASRATYRARAAEEAAAAHHRNNAIRDELYHYQDTGIIEIVSDSFLDGQKKADKPVEGKK